MPKAEQTLRSVGLSHTSQLLILCMTASGWEIGGFEEHRTISIAVAPRPTLAQGSSIWEDPSYWKIVNPELGSKHDGIIKTVTMKLPAIHSQSKKKIHSHSKNIK